MRRMMMLAALALTACGSERSEPTPTAEPAEKKAGLSERMRNSSRPDRAPIQQAAEWSMVIAELSPSHSAVLVSGREGEQRVIAVNPRSGYTIAEATVTCPSGDVRVRQARRAAEDGEVPRTFPGSHQLHIQGDVARICAGGGMHKINAPVPQAVAETRRLLARAHAAEMREREDRIRRSSGE